MSNSVTRQVMVNTQSVYQVKFTIVGDGSGEETATRVNAVTGDMSTSNKIEMISASLSGFSANLLFDATTDVVACNIPNDADVHFDFRAQGAPGLANNSGAGKTGDVVITTSGLGNGDAGTIVLRVRKK